MASEVGSAEIYFAKRLANTDKKIRDKSLKRLQMWISAKMKSGKDMEEKDMVNLWRGLFYCMWFSDKPLIQEELTDTLADILQLFNPPCVQGIHFAKVFFDTLGKEWHSIDRLRMDKFFMLAKKYIIALFRYLSNANWPEEVTKALGKFLTDLFLEEKYPDSLKMYWAEYFLKELVGVIEVSNNLPTDQTLVYLLDPFFSCMAFSSIQSVKRMIGVEVLSKLSTIQLTNEDGEGNTVMKEMPLETFADRLYDLATNKSVKTKNRKRLFTYINEYRNGISEVPENDSSLTECPTKKKKVTE